MSDWHSPYSPAAGAAVATRERPAEVADREELDDRAELLAHRRARRRARARRLATGAAGITALLILWQLAAMVGAGFLPFLAFIIERRIPKTIAERLETDDATPGPRAFSTPGRTRRSSPNTRR